MTSAPIRSLTARTALLLGLGGLTLLTGCQAAQPDAAAPVATSTPPVVDVAAPVATSTAPGTAAAATPTRSATPPTCPDAASLFGLLPADEAAVARVAPGPASCAGDWAVIGLLHQGGQSVSLFSSATGRWAPADAGRACAGGELPAELVDGVCNAG